MKKLIALLLTMVMALVLCSCGKSSTYEKATLQMKEGNYEEAIALFKSISDYEDSNQKIKECEAVIVEANYTSAIELLNSEQFSEAQAAFEALGEYKDSADRLKECKYGQAAVLAENSAPKAACELFRELHGYKDSKQQIAQILKQSPDLAQLGDHYFFGSYEQDNNVGNGAEEIEWIIVNIADGQLKLEAMYLLDTQPYHNSMEKVSWASCSLRTWLNDTFYQKAFTPEQQSHILSTKIGEKDDATEDKVFLRGIGDTNDEPTSPENKTDTATAYAVANGAKSETYCPSWMRQYHGDSWWGTYWSKDLDQDFMTIVEANGARVNELGICIRPMVWVEVPGVRAVAESEEESASESTGAFTNKFGTAETKCAHKGCNNYIASSGDTNCCTTHSNRCLSCNCFIDEDAMYCMSCLTSAASKPSTSSSGCKFKYSDGSACGAKCTDYPSMCNKHMEQLQGIYDGLTK